MPKISALPPMTTAAADDEAPIVDDSATQTKKFTLTVLKEWFQSLVGWITAAMVEAGAITPEKLLSGNGTSWVYQSWTPTLTNFTGTVNVAKYCIIGKTCHFYIKVTQGASVTGQHIFTLPATASTNEPSGGLGSSNANIIANGAIQDAGTAYYDGIGILQSTTTCGLGLRRADATFAQLNTTSPTLPMTWSNAVDTFALKGCYEIA